MFRAINDRLTHDDPLVETTGCYVIACECADPSCMQTLVVPPPMYEQVRRSPVQFLVALRHVQDDEDIVDVGADYLIVEKFGEAAQVAASLKDTLLIMPPAGVEPAHVG